MAKVVTELEVLGAAVKRRRLTLALSVAEAARRAGITRATWTSLENGARETHSYSYSPIERTLGWAGGSIEAIRTGGEPTPNDQGPAPADMDLGALVRMVAEVLDSKFSNGTKVSMIRDLIDEASSYVAADDNANRGAPDSATG